MATGFLELGEIMMTRSERHLESVSHNISNASTPGYKKTVTFDDAMNDASAPHVGTRTDMTQGALQLTGRPLDLAISGPGFFALRAPNGIYYSRGGQFERDGEGRVVNAQGFALQTSTGEDLVLRAGAPEILADGSVVENGLPIASIGLFQAADDAPMQALGGTLFAASDDSMREVASPLLRQGVLETANVDTAAEMIQMMSTMRDAEIGARIVQTYDSLMGQSISTFGRSSR